MGLGNWSWDVALSTSCPPRSSTRSGAGRRRGAPELAPSGLVLRRAAHDRGRGRLFDRRLRRRTAVGAHGAAHPAAHRRATAHTAGPSLADDVASAAARLARVARARAVALAPGRTVARLAAPLAAWILFNATIVVWHIPAAYDLTESNGVVHACEHAIFFFFGLLFWARVIDVGPLRPHVDWGAARLHRRRDDRRLGARDRLRCRAHADLRALRPHLATPSRRNQARSPTSSSPAG